MQKKVSKTKKVVKPVTKKMAQGGPLKKDSTKTGNRVNMGDLLFPSSKETTLGKLGKTTGRASSIKASNEANKKGKKIDYKIDLVNVDGQKYLMRKGGKIKCKKKC